jgi:adenylate cyclase
MAAAVVLVLLLSLRLVDPSPLVAIRNVIFDGLQRGAQTDEIDSPVVVVEIDDASLARLGQWPWSRRRLAQLVDQLALKGASVIAWDVVFAEPDRLNPSDDEFFTKSLKMVPSVGGIAFTRQPGDSATPPPIAGFVVSGPSPLRHLPTFLGATLPLQRFRDVFVGLGGLNGLPDADGTYRRLPLLHSTDGQLYPSMIAEVVRTLTKDTTYRIKVAGGSGEPAFSTHTGIVSVQVGRPPRAVTIPTDANGALILKPREIATDHRVPAWQVIEGITDPKLLAGHIALIGASAPGLVDLHQTALGLQPGVEIEARAISQILAGDYLGRPDWMTGLELILAGSLGAILIYLLPMLGAPWGAFLVALAYLGLGASAYTAYSLGHRLFDPVYPGLCVAGTYLVVTMDSFRTVERERAFIRHAFSRYLSPTLVRELAANPARLRIGGERRMMSFILTDIAGFTALSEKLGPELLTPIINRYFDGASDIVMKHGGMVNQFAGDSILAFFNAPAEQPDHAARALACARDLDAFAEGFRRRESSDQAIFGVTRIGVHTGFAVVGNFGSSRRFQYGALGDTLNTTSRIEEINKYFSTRVCASELTVRSGGDMNVRPLGTVQFIGKKEYLEIFEVRHHGQESEDPLKTYRQAYQCLQQGESDEASRLFYLFDQEVPNDGPTRFHLARLNAGHRDHRIAMDRK